MNKSTQKYNSPPIYIDDIPIYIDDYSQDGKIFVDQDSDKQKYNSPPIYINGYPYYGKFFVDQDSDNDDINEQITSQQDSIKSKFIVFPFKIKIFWQQIQAYLIQIANNSLNSTQIIQNMLAIIQCKYKENSQIILIESMPLNLDILERYLKQKPITIIPYIAQLAMMQEQLLADPLRNLKQKQMIHFTKTQAACILASCFFNLFIPYTQLQDDNHHTNFLNKQSILPGDTEQIQEQKMVFHDFIFQYFEQIYKNREDCTYMDRKIYYEMVKIPKSEQQGGGGSIAKSKTFMSKITLLNKKPMNIQHKIELIITKKNIQQSVRFLESPELLILNVIQQEPVEPDCVLFVHGTQKYSQGGIAYEYEGSHAENQSNLKRNEKNVIQFIDIDYPYTYPKSLILIDKIRGQKYSKYINQNYLKDMFLTLDSHQNHESQQILVVLWLGQSLLKNNMEIYCHMRGAQFFIDQFKEYKVSDFFKYCIKSYQEYLDMNEFMPIFQFISDNVQVD